jgi:hypothetical protein
VNHGKSDAPARAGPGALRAAGGARLATATGGRGGRRG